MSNAKEALDVMGRHGDLMVEESKKRSHEDKAICLFSKCEGAIAKKDTEKLLERGLVISKIFLPPHHKLRNGAEFGFRVRPVNVEEVERQVTVTETVAKFE